MRFLSYIFTFLFFIFIFIFSVFFVYETDRALILQLGELKLDGIKNRPKIYEPGIHFKIPFFQEDLHFDLRLKLLDVKSSRITTSEKKDVLVDFYILWQVDDLALYYTRTAGVPDRAEQLLRQKIVSALKAEFGRCTIGEVVYGGRSELMLRLKEITDESTKNLGISVADLRIKRIDLPDEVRDSVYLRMRAERDRVASETRANGIAESTKIMAIADRDNKIIIAEAVRKSKELKAQGEALALSIYATAYERDPKFYDFYRSILAYKNIFSSGNNLMILNPNSSFFKYFSNFSPSSL
jgi:membrane protease subunit HflC